MTVYRIFDIAMACPFTIAGLPVLQNESPDWSVDRVLGAIPGNEIEWFHRWKALNGDEVMACARHGKKYLLRFNGLACFSVDFDLCAITVLAESSCPENTLAHLLLDQVIPRVLGHLGRVVLHASVVELADGRAVAFTGASGQGKSTLATAFFSAGHRLLSDDCLLLENNAGAVYAMASYPSLRLWADSAQAVVEGDRIQGARYSEMAHYTNKQQLLFDADDISAAPHLVRLERLYLLEDAGAGPVRITPAGGMASIMTLIESLFKLDVVSEAYVRRNFEIVGQVAGSMMVKRLAYPRDYEVLPEVIAAVLRDQGEAASTKPKSTTRP